MEDLIPRNAVITNDKTWIYQENDDVDNFKSQNRGGKGIKGMQTSMRIISEGTVYDNAHHYIMFFTNTGRVYRLKAYEIS